MVAKGSGLGGRRRIRGGDGRGLSGQCEIRAALGGVQSSGLQRAGFEVRGGNGLDRQRAATGGVSEFTLLL